MEYEIEPMDRIYELVSELMEQGEDADEILDVAEEAIADWRAKNE
jgi:hypothetical protein